jgi:uncharacterized membrane protein YdjX (TVP38/TMEM64 family)
MQSKKVQKKAMIKVSILLAFIFSAVVVVRLTPVSRFLVAYELSRLLETTGFWAPLVFMAIYVVGVCLFIPGTVLGAMGTILFVGAYWGFVYVWVGAMVGASAAFLIDRHLGKEFAASLIGDKLRKYDDAIERNGFAATLYLRLVYFPFTPMNFGMGLT